MNNVIRNVLLGGLLWLAVPLAAQVPQDLIDKAKAAGMTDDQIRQEINKRMGQSGTEQATRTASDAVVTDRTVAIPDGKVIPPLDAQREANRPAGDLSGTVFGREIFSNKNLSFEPDLNVPTPKGYVLSAGDELLINVWGDSELNLKLKNGFGIILRAYDEGVAYRFYTQRKGKTIILNETAAYQFGKDKKAWLPYTTTPEKPFAMAFQNIYHEPVMCGGSPTVSTGATIE